MEGHRARRAASQDWLLGPHGSGSKLPPTAAVEFFLTLFGDLLVFVYRCFDRIVIHGYLSGPSRLE
jgi:hypothetical protein